MTRLYEYVGPAKLADLAHSDILRFEPASQEEFATWLRANYDASAVTLTYVVTAEGRLRVSDRHAEHVACAKGQAVLAAGELEVSVGGSSVFIDGVTNQSTGYCPEPECYPL